MKITFADKSSIEFKKSGDNVIIIAAARDSLNTLKLISNCIEITKEQFEELVADVK